MAVSPSRTGRREIRRITRFDAGRAHSGLTTPDDPARPAQLARHDTLSDPCGTIDAQAATVAGDGGDAGPEIVTEIETKE